MTLNPVAASIIQKSNTWKVSKRKCQIYQGTTVSAKASVPMRKELVIQLMRSKGNWRAMRIGHGTNSGFGVGTSALPTVVAFNGERLCVVVDSIAFDPIGPLPVSG